MARTVDLIFGSGRYKCLGAPIAWLELEKVFVELLRNFEIAILDPLKPMVSVDHGVWLQSGLIVKITEREI
jgi:cytochrome P450